MTTQDKTSSGLDARQLTDAEIDAISGGALFLAVPAGAFSLGLVIGAVAGAAIGAALVVDALSK
ncbi:MAG: hypothetical protein AB1749_07365 [Pseudomonadota bacterium]